MKETYLDLLAFLKNPVDQPDSVQTKTEKAKKLLLLLIIEVPIMAILIAILNGLQSLGLYNADSHKLITLLETIPVWPLLFLLVIIVPFIEELIFRIYLRYRRNYLAHFIVSLVSITGTKNKIKIETYFNNLWTTKYRVIFYFSAILFAIIHITNYEYSKMIVLFSPIIVAPQFVVGLLCGYLRVRHNLVLGYFMHAIHNAIFVSIPLLSIAGDHEVLNLNVNTNSYSIKVTELVQRPSESKEIYSSNTITIKNLSIKSILSSLLNENEMLIKSNNELILEKRVDLDFTNKLKDNSQNKIIVVDLITKLCHFKIIKETKRQEVWELFVTDSTLLAKHIADASPTNTLSTSSEKVSIKNLGIGSLAKGLTTGCKKFIINKTSTKKNFDIILHVKDFEMLKKQLNVQYGLSLKKAEKEMEFTIIEFPNK